MSEKKTEKARKELTNSKMDLLDTFEGKALSKDNVELSKEELKDYRERVKNAPEAVRERYIDMARVDKLLKVIEKDKGLLDRIDEAIEFLDKYEKNEL